MYPVNSVIHLSYDPGPQCSFSSCSAKPCNVICYKKSKALEPTWRIAVRTYPSFCSMKRPGVLLLPRNGMLVHRRSLPCNLFSFPNNSPAHIYTPGWREALRVKCLAQEHNIIFPARARTRTAWSGDRRTNHEATAPQLERCSIEWGKPKTKLLLPVTMGRQYNELIKTPSKYMIVAEEGTRHDRFWFYFWLDKNV